MMGLFPRIRRNEARTGATNILSLRANSEDIWPVKEDNMYKRIIMTSMPALLAGLFALGAPVWADDYGSQAAAKFSRGIINLATGWLEVPKNISNESQKSNAGVGLTYGTVKGSVHTAGRSAAGALDVATFYVPSPSIVHSEHVWDDFDRETTYGTGK